MTSLMKFPTGHVVATPGAMDALTRPEMLAMLRRHINGDWGDVSPDDAQRNNDALEQGERLLSAYSTASKDQKHEVDPTLSKHASVKVWIITEADRSSTCILLPEEY